MKYLFGIAGLVLVALFGIYTGNRLEPDALLIAIGALIGGLIAMPMLLIVVAGQRPREQRPEWEQQPPPQRPKVVVNQPPQLTIHNHYYGDGAQVLNVGARTREFEELEEIEWVQKLSTATAPKRITTTANNRSNSRR